MGRFNPEDHFAEDRLDKRQQLMDRDINPYPHEFDVNISIPAFNERYRDVDDSGLIEEERYSLAGRISTGESGIREHGGISFVDIENEAVPGDEGSIQIMLDREGANDYDLLEGTEDYEFWLDVIDRGDIIGTHGYPLVSNSGELSLYADDVDMLSKALIHPPTGELSDEERVRNRAAAMWEEDLQQTLRTRFDMERKVREHLWDEDYMEVSTNLLQNIYGGAAATPFKTYTEAKDQDMYLRIALELPLKIMTVGGFGSPIADDPQLERGIFEIGPVFRNEDIDSTHNPEFTMIEGYEPNADYTDAMDLVEDLITDLAEDINGSYEIPYAGDTIDLSPEWDRIPMDEAIEEQLDITLQDLSDEELREVAESYGAEFPGGFSRGLGEAELFEEAVEEELQDPVFVIDHPQETTPLCTPHRQKEGRIERFELFIGGIEYVNSYTELTDPIVQGGTFADQVARYDEGDEEAHQMDTDFLHAQGHGMPPQAGWGIGIDRLAMLMTDSQSIRDVRPFPMVGRED